MKKLNVVCTVAILALAAMVLIGCDQPQVIPVTIPVIPVIPETIPVIPVTVGQK